MSHILEFFDERGAKMEQGWKNVEKANIRRAREPRGDLLPLPFRFSIESGIRFGFCFHFIASGDLVYLLLFIGLANVNKNQSELQKASPLI